MFHSGPVKEEFSQSTYQMLPYGKSWSSKNKSIRYEALVEEVHETDSTEFIKYQTLASSDRNLTGLSTNSKTTKQMEYSYLVLCLLNAFLSYTGTMLNIVTIHSIRKTSNLSKNLKILLLSTAVSDLDVGLLTQPVGTLDSRTQTKGRKWVSFELSKFILGSEAAGNKIK